MFGAWRTPTSGIDAPGGPDPHGFESAASIPASPAASRMAPTDRERSRSDHRAGACFAAPDRRRARHVRSRPPGSCPTEFQTTSHDSRRSTSSSGRRLAVRSTPRRWADGSRGLAGEPETKHDHDLVLLADDLEGRSACVVIRDTVFGQEPTPSAPGREQHGSVLHGRHRRTRPGLSRPCRRRPRAPRRAGWSPLSGSPPDARSGRATRAFRTSTAGSRLELPASRPGNPRIRSTTLCRQRLAGVFLDLRAPRQRETEKKEGVACHGCATR